ncbi:DivIVA domain-containing protein [Cellulosilyticum sp. I15G10I2]|uniref:DivIVA domain-containing protein n=1 Tax=Cellulosilyticum sp. I15G10I2 TaxID=1892843 RepID=UPI00085BC4F7|nr:DivIVA domain-containing protein [Cellulosilyticum sp. I15G10I2]
MLSPVDIQNKVFKKSKIGGYNVEEVNDFVEEVIRSYQELINENYALKDKMNILNESIQYYRTMEATIQNVLVLADKTAQDTKSAAYEKAEQIKKDAEQRAEKMIFSAEERVSRILEKGRQEAFELDQNIEAIKRQYKGYKIQFNQILQAQLEIIENNEDKSLAKEDDLFKETPTVTEEEKDLLTGFEPLNLDEDNKFYTKEYMPICDEELA